LSPGYWQDQDKTSSAFLFRQGADGATSRVYRTGDLARQDADGLFYYLGRSDSQIKSRGYRIELGEVETAVHSVIGIRECAVVAIPSTDFEGHTICCAYVCDPDRSLSPADLRREVSALLPQYMLPSRWLTIERFPKNANGKIDRPALREQFQAAHALENHAQ
jgi:acyl-coenzyme A synthetase/AMP-(fatty) acid ligase